MAIITSFDKNFEVTAISFSPNIITVGEETSYSISIKNVSGKKISGMYAQMRLYYRATDGKVHGSDSMFVYGGPTYDFKSISWASNAVKTFTGKFAFTPISAYPPNIDTRLLPLFKGSDAGYSESSGGNERLGLFLSITTSNMLGDSWGNGDVFFDLRGANSENLYVIDARYKPTINTFAAERSIGSVLNDEGENLLMNVALSKSAAARPEFMHLYLYYQDKAKPELAPAVIDLTSKISSALSSEIATVISETLDKNADWNLLLWFGDKYESVTSVIEVSRAFANVHLSGASTGGVCFGSFSKATENKPLFQCYYPAEFEAGIRGVTNYIAAETDTGGTWLDGKKIYRQVVPYTITAVGSPIAVADMPDIAMLIRLGGFAIPTATPDMFLPMPHYARASAYNIAWIQAGKLYVQSSRAITGRVTIEYTKTTEEVS